MEVGLGQHSVRVRVHLSGKALAKMATCGEDGGVAAMSADQARGAKHGWTEALSAAQGRRQEARNSESHMGR